MTVLRISAVGLSCIAAPALAVALGTVLFFIDQPDVAKYFIADWFGLAALGATLGALYGIPAMLLVGLPWHSYLQRRGTTGLLNYSVGGALAGLLASIAFMATMGGWRWPTSFADWGAMTKVLIVGSFTGMLASSLFRALWWVRQRSANPPTSAP